MKRLFCVVMALSMWSSGICYGENLPEETEFNENKPYVIYDVDSEQETSDLPEYDTDGKQEDFYPSVPSADGTDAYTEDVTRRVYDFNALKYGFNSGDGISDAVIYQSELWARVLGSQSFITSDDGFSVEAALIPQIQIKYKNQTPGTEGRLYFVTDNNAEYTEENSYVFPISDGDGTYIIDTETNTGWKGNISGIRFVPSDGDGVVCIDSISFEKFECSVDAADGKINISGNMYGKSGNMTVQAVNAENGNVDYSKKISAKLNGTFTHSFSISSALEAPTVYYITFSGSRLNGTFKKRVVYVTADYAEQILKKINTARLENDAEALESLLEDNLELLSLSAQHYTELLNDDIHLEEFYLGMLGNSAQSKEELEEQMNEQAVRVRVKYMTDEQWLGAIEKYDEYIHFKDLSSYKNYESASDAVKVDIAKYMSRENIETFEDVRNAFEKNLILRSIAHAVAWGDVRDILETSADLIGIDLTEVNALSDQAAAYRQLTEKSFDSFAALKTAFDNAVKTQKANEKDDKDKKPTKTGGGGGGGTIISGTPVTPITPVTSEKEQDNKPTVKPDNDSNNDKTQQDQINKPTFNDLMEYEWAKPAIDNLYHKAVVNGENGNYVPARQITREEFVKMIAGVFKLSANKKAEFEDVPSDAWYSTYISAAFEAGIVEGYGGVFGVGQAISRQDASVMLARIICSDDSEYDSDFSDDAEISDYAKNAVNSLTEMGIIEGYADNSFRPKNTLTRAEAAVIINRVMERMSL